MNNLNKSRLNTTLESKLLSDDGNGNNNNNQLNSLIASVLTDLKAQTNPEELKSFIIKLITSEYIFQNRTRQAIKSILEEKYFLLHKLSLLEQAAGIADRETGDRLIDQLQRWQEENERQRATIAYLKIRIQMLENAATQQDEYYRRNVADMTRQHNEQLQAIFRRHEETEVAFLAYQKSTSEDLAELAKLRHDLATIESKSQINNIVGNNNVNSNSNNNINVASGGLSLSAAANSNNSLPSTPTLGRKSSKAIGNLFGGNNDLAQVQMDLSSARRKIQDLSAEKLTLTERLKMAEKLRDMKEQENITLRDNMTQLRKTMQEDVLIQLQDAHEKEEKESNKDVIFVQDEAGNKRLKGGTAEKLISRLLDPTIHDHQYQVAILLTHKTFMTSLELLNIILNTLLNAASAQNNNNNNTHSNNNNNTHNTNTNITNTNTTSNNNINSTPSLETVNKSQVFRCANIIRFWILNYWGDFHEAKVLTTLKESMIKMPEQASNIIRTALKNKTDLTNKIGNNNSLINYIPNNSIDLSSISSNSQNKPKPILPKFLAKFYQNPNSNHLNNNNNDINNNIIINRDNNHIINNNNEFNLSASSVVQIQQDDNNNENNDNEDDNNNNIVNDNNNNVNINNNNNSNNTTPGLINRNSLGDDFDINKLPSGSVFMDLVSTGIPAIISNNGTYIDYGFGPTSSLIPTDITFKQIKFLDIDATEFARQITLIEFELFRTLRSREFLNLSWMKDEKDVLAPNIMRIMRWTNHVISWLISEIVLVKDSIKLRVATLEKVLAIGAALDKLNNFNGVKEVIAALNSSSVYRLRKTQEMLGTKYVRIHDDLTKLTSNEMNKKNLRNRIHSSDPPLIPFPGLYQGDLVFLDTCNKDKLEGGLINFYKVERITSIILELEAYQQVNYNLEPVKEIQDYVKFYNILDDDSQYSHSLQCEARTNN